MKITHNPNPAYIRHTSPIYSEVGTDERYEAEIESSRRKAMRAWKRAQKALERAERKLTPKSPPKMRDALEQLRAEVERRWLELHELEVQMQQGPSTGANRSGKGSVRNPLPKGSKL